MVVGTAVFKTLNQVQGDGLLKQALRSIINVVVYNGYLSAI